MGAWTFLCSDEYPRISKLWTWSLLSLLILLLLCLEYNLGLSRPCSAAYNGGLFVVSYPGADRVVLSQSEIFLCSCNLVLYSLLARQLGTIRTARNGTIWGNNLSVAL